MKLPSVPKATARTSWIVGDAGKGVCGPLALFHAGRELKAVRATCDSAYDGVTLDRTLVSGGFGLDRLLPLPRARCRTATTTPCTWMPTSSAVLLPGEFHVSGEPLSGRLGYRHFNSMFAAPGRGSLAVAHLGQSRPQPENRVGPYAGAVGRGGFRHGVS